MTLDAANRAWTVLAGAVVAFVSLGVFSVRSTTGAAVSALALGSLALAWAMSPRAIVVDENEIRVERRAWSPLRIPLGMVDVADPLDSTRAALRIFGVGGFFGNYGVFWSRALGRFRLYSTRGGNGVIVRRRDEKLPIVLTPDDVGGTLRALRMRTM